MSRPSASWDSRARWHGERLAREGITLSPGLLGSLARHEGTFTVEATRDFSAKLLDAYLDARAHTGAVK